MTSYPGGKRYRALGPYLRERFGGPVRKLPLDAGFSCPNRDGTVARGGCTYCNNEGFGSSAATLPLAGQLARGAARARGGDTRFIAYFQSYTNTHGPADRLRALFEEALAYPGVVALAVGTRPDCLPGPVLALLADLAQRHPVWLELGLQSASDATLEAINRGHTVADFEDAVQRCRATGIEVVAHLIAGLPGDSRDTMLDSARLLARLGVAGVKLHLLHVVRDTALEQHYYRGGVPLLGPRQYVEITCDQLECLPPETVIHRLQADCPADLLVAPAWINRKNLIINEIDRTLAARDSWQGKRFSG
jgi:radical SAM protein (TIGR01212 family)